MKPIDAIFLLPFLKFCVILREIENKLPRDMSKVNEVMQSDHFIFLLFFYFLSQISLHKGDVNYV
jgi:hypothetical protein